MTIEKAIGYLQGEMGYVRGIGMQSRIGAIKLGIGALKRELEHRKIDNSPCAGILPGETKE